MHQDLWSCWIDYVDQHKLVVDKGDQQTEYAADNIRALINEKKATKAVRTVAVK